MDQILSKKGKKRGSYKLKIIIKLKNERNKKIG